MLPQFSRKSTIDIIINLLFLALFAFAIFFREERLLADSGYYLLQVINIENFRVEHYRFILTLSQWLPLIAVKLGLPLKQVILLYSIGHWLFFYVIYLICRHVYKNHEAGILLVLLQALGIASGFFTPMFELYYGAALLVLFACVLYHSPNKISSWIIIILTAFFAVTGHPFANILLLYILVIHALQFRFQYVKHYLVFVLLIVALFIFKVKTATEYEQGKSAAFIETLKNGVYNWDYLLGLKHFLAKYYMEMLLLFIIPGIYFFCKKKFLLLTLYILSFSGLLALVNVSSYGFEQSRYQEQVYFPLSFIVAYTLCFFVLKDSKYKIVITGIIVIVFVFRMNAIWNDGMKFRQRVDVMKNLIEKAQHLPGNKFVVSEAYAIEHGKIHPNWSYPIETLLLSASNASKTITICTDADMNFGDNKLKLKPHEYLFRRWEIYPVKSLNKKYFQMEKTDYINLENTNTFPSK